MRHSSVPAVRVVKNNSQSLSEIPTDMGYLGKTSGLPAWWERVYSRLTFKLDYLNNEGWPHWLSVIEPLFGRFAARANIVGLHKHLHYRSWFRHELAQYVNDILTDPRTRNMPFWDPKSVGRISVDHTHGRKNYVLEINAVLTLEAVERLLFRELPPVIEPFGRSPIPRVSSIPVTRS
jgi:asparagine synthase (glutamine-hydrolysing)